MLLSQYIAQLHASGAPMHHASYAVYGVSFYMPHVRFRLGMSIRCLKGWRELQPTRSASPLTWELTCFIAATLAANQLTHHAIATLLAFHCYLRVGEFSSMTVADVAFPADPRLGSAYSRMGVRIAKAKTGNNQWVSIDCPILATSLQRFIQSQHSSSRATTFLFDFTAASYSFTFKRCCHMLGIGNLGFSPHSLRHGGATRDRLLGVPALDIQRRGRWKAASSIDIYVQTGGAQLLTTSVPSHLVQRGYLLSQSIPTWLYPCISPSLQ
jgi:integrase